VPLPRLSLRTGVVDDRRKLPGTGRSAEHALAHLRWRLLSCGESQPGCGRRHPADLVRALLAAPDVVLEPAPLGIIVDAVQRVDTGQDVQVGTE
jgi:hypothetical protein